MEVPSEAAEVNVAFLPPMSGLAATEPKWEPGRVNVLVGEGQTAQVLRNLCFQIHSKTDGGNDWRRVCRIMSDLFGIELLAPEYVAERGEITMAYKQRRIQLDISSSGRGLQQTLLLLAHLYSNPGTVLLLDEPDAHLEILRQREIYTLLTNTAGAQGSQIIAASHSEVILNEACGKDTVIAFVGTPHRIDDRGTQVLKSLRDIGFDQYYQAEQMGWVLYLEGPTDLAILQAFSDTLGHTARKYLERPFVHYVSSNLPSRAEAHFFGLREAKPNLVGIAVFDRLEVTLSSTEDFVETMWSKREIENYLCAEDVLLAYARRDEADDLFSAAEREPREEAMRAAIREVSDALKVLDMPSPWSDDIKASDDFLDRVFRTFCKKLRLPLEMRKSEYHQLAKLVPAHEIHQDIVETLDEIVRIAARARPGR